MLLAEHNLAGELGHICTSMTSVVDYQYLVYKIRIILPKSVQVNLKESFKKNLMEECGGDKNG